MSRAALNVLDNDPDGFFLMIEGGAVDWASHDNRSGRMIEEQIDFNRAVEAVVQWVEDNSSWHETLVIVTGDHETGYLTGPGSGPGSPPVWNDLVNNGTSILPGMQWNSGSHTNSLIPIFARGEGISHLGILTDEHDPVRGRFISNTEIAQVCRLLWLGGLLPTGVRLAGGGIDTLSPQLVGVPNPFPCRNEDSLLNPRHDSCKYRSLRSWWTTDRQSH